jgi:hypothetical protein
LDTIGWSNDLTLSVFSKIGEDSKIDWENIKKSLAKDGASGSVIATIETAYKAGQEGEKVISEDSFMDMLSSSGASASVLATIKSQMDTSATNALSASSIETMLSKADASDELIQTITTQISGEVDVELSDQMKLLNNIASNTFGTLDVLNRILLNQRRIQGWGPGEGMEGVDVWRGYWGTGPALVDWSQEAQHGGVFEGPSSGYPMTLHGREAVIPMQHGNDIPVKIRGGNDDEVVGLLRELIYELKQKDTSPKITVTMDKQKLMRDTAKYVNERIERRVIGE